jgi:hypothetical protein
MPVDHAEMNRKLFAALKPGGMLVIADHSAKSGDGTSVGKSLHRIEESALRREVEAVGFKLVAEGDFWRHPEDARATFRSSRRAAKRSTSSCSNIRSQCERAARRLSRLPWSPPSAKDCRRPGMPNPRMCAGSAARALGSGGSGRGAALMALPEASWLRWSNLRPRKAADRPKAVEDAYDRCWAHLPPCCARAASSRFMRSSTSLCS